MNDHFSQIYFSIKKKKKYNSIKAIEIKIAGIYYHTQVTCFNSVHYYGVELLIFITKHN